MLHSTIYRLGQNFLSYSVAMPILTKSQGLYYLFTHSFMVYYSLCFGANYTDGLVIPLHQDHQDF